MKLKFIVLVLIIGVLFSPILTAEKTGDKEEAVLSSVPSSTPGLFLLDQFLIDHLPGGYLYPFVFENYVPDATFLCEENNGFSLIDNPRVYFEGDSFVNFNWFYNGTNINSALNDGSPGVILPFSMVNSFQLHGESPLADKYGMNFISEMPQKNESRLTASSVLTDVGGYLFEFMIQPDHPSTRADRLYTHRRKIDSNYFLDYRLNKSFNRSQLTLGLSYFDIQRQFNDFNTFDSTYNTDGRLLMASTGYKKELRKGYYKFYGAFNYLDRSNQQAELGAYPQETIGKERLSLLAGFALKKNRFELDISLLFEKEDLTPFEKNFSKDLMDNDGDGIYPYGDSGELKTGRFTGTTINLDLNHRMFEGLFNGSVRIDTFAGLRYSGITGDEESRDFNTLFFDNNPYQVVLWTPGNKYTNSNMNAQAGIKIDAGLTRDISLAARLFLDYNGLYFDNSGNNLDFFTPAFDVGIHLFRTKRTSLLLFYGVLPYDIRENANFFLESNRPSGTIYRWNDINGDSIYQPGEEASIYGYTGGQYHYVDNDIAVPMKQRLLLQFSTPLSRNWTLNIKAMYKRIKNRFRIKFDKEYGFYETHEGQNLYFFTEPFRDYYLTNNGYEKEPFYAQFSFDISGKREHKWFFTFSFMAHMGMGDTAFGNGPGSNDIGILDESQANPNSWINGFGRLDGDRGFVSKSYFGYYLAKKLFLAVSLKYRDGNPFAFLNTLSNYNQQIIYYSTIKAENEKGVKGGPREDYIADVSIRLNYRFKLLHGEAEASLSVFNILDIGAELSEYVFSGGTRDAVELQIPRSIRFTLGWRF